MNWKALRQSLDQHAGAARQVFFRDDDVDCQEDTLEQLIQLHLRHQIPIHLAVIPGLLTDAAIDYLRAQKKASPHLIEINQHGWMHRNHQPEGRKCEFGSARTYLQQLADIKAGREKLTAAFQSDFYPVFVPPWNRCNDDTLQALAELSFKGVSMLSKGEALASPRIPEISVTLDLFTWQQGARLKSAEQLEHELLAQLAGQQTIGIMLHHKVMKAEAFALCDTLMQILRQSEVINFVTFETLLTVK